MPPACAYNSYPGTGGYATYTPPPPQTQSGYATYGTAYTYDYSNYPPQAQPPPQNYSAYRNSKYDYEYAPPPSQPQTSAVPPERDDDIESISIAASTISLDPSPSLVTPACAICGSSQKKSHCRCESLALQAAIEDAETHILGGLWQDVRAWATSRAHTSITTAFEKRSSQHRHRFSATVSARRDSLSARDYEALQRGLQRVVDDEWRACLGRYPQMLEYYYGVAEEAVRSGRGLEGVLNGCGTGGGDEWAAEEKTREREREKEKEREIKDRKREGVTYVRGYTTRGGGGGGGDSGGMAEKERHTGRSSRRRRKKRDEYEYD